MKLSLLLFLFMTASSTWTVANLFKQLNERLLVSMSQSHQTQREKTHKTDYTAAIDGFAQVLRNQSRGLSSESSP